MIGRLHSTSRIRKPRHDHTLSRASCTRGVQILALLRAWFGLKVRVGILCHSWDHQNARSFFGTHYWGEIQLLLRQKINMPNTSKVKFDLDFQKSQFGKVGRLDLNTILSMHAIHYSTAHYFSAANQP